MSTKPSVQVTEVEEQVEEIAAADAGSHVIERTPLTETMVAIGTLKSWVQKKATFIRNKLDKGGSANDVREIDDDELRAIFKEFDLNGDGFIQMDELRSVMVKMGQSPTEEEIQAMFKAADKDNDGNIDFNEFMSIAKANPLSMSLRSVFEELDVDGDGHITRGELRMAFEKMGHALSDEEIKAIYRQVDVNNDGKINFEEFCMMMTRKPT